MVVRGVALKGGRAEGQHARVLHVPRLTKVAEVEDGGVGQRISAALARPHGVNEPPVLGDGHHRRLVNDQQEHVRKLLLKLRLGAAPIATAAAQASGSAAADEGSCTPSIGREPDEMLAVTSPGVAHDRVHHLGLHTGEVGDG